MFSYDRNNTFVCLDEITGCVLEINPVIYNPGKDSIAFRTELLYRTINDHLGIKLSSEQLISLTRYEVHQLKDFVRDLREIIRKEKNNK